MALGVMHLHASNFELTYFRCVSHRSIEPFLGRWTINPFSLTRSWCDFFFLHHPFSIISFSRIFELFWCLDSFKYRYENGNESEKVNFLFLFFVGPSIIGPSVDPWSIVPIGAIGTGQIMCLERKTRNFEKKHRLWPYARNKIYSHI